MAAKQSNQQGGSSPIAPRTATQAVWVRPLALAAEILFFISWVFPVAAGLAKDTASFPKWWGTLDVGIAFVVAILVLAIQVVVRGKVDKQVEDASYRIYRILIHGLLAMAALFMLGGDRVTWVNCATGLAWRTWLALYILPSWLIALRSHTGYHERHVLPRH